MKATSNVSERWRRGLDVAHVLPPKPAEVCWRSPPKDSEFPPPNPLEVVSRPPLKVSLALQTAAEQGQRTQRREG